MTDSLWFHARHLILLIIGHSHLYDLMIWKYLLYILWVNWVSELHCFFILKCTFKTYAKQSLGGSAINILALEECLITLMFTDGSKGVFFELNLKSSDPFSVPQDVLSPGAPGAASVSHFQFTTGEGGIWVVVLQPFFCVQFFGFVLVIPPPPNNYSQFTTRVPKVIASPRGLFAITLYSPASSGEHLKDRVFDVKVKLDHI